MRDDFESTNPGDNSQQASERLHGDRTSIAPEFIELMGDPPVIDGEDPEEFHSLLGRMAIEIKPKGPIEISWTHRLTCLLWEIRRLERFKTQNSQERAGDGLTIFWA